MIEDVIKVLEQVKRDLAILTHEAEQRMEEMADIRARRQNAGEEESEAMWRAYVARKKAGYSIGSAMIQVDTAIGCLNAALRAKKAEEEGI